MHATADTTDFIFGKGLGRRVMRGVGRLLAEPKSQGLAGRALTQENSCE